jgi:hypothetical protein
VLVVCASLFFLKNSQIVTNSLDLGVHVASIDRKS